MNPCEKKEDNLIDERGDYIFRFGISLPQSGNESGEPLIDFVRCQLQDLLQIVVLTYDGKRVKVNGFQLLNDTEREHSIWVKNE